MAKHNCKTVFHLSGDREHIRVDHFPDLKIHRQCNTPVIGGGYWCKKFGKPEYWYRLDESKTWLPINQFAAVFLQAQHPEIWQKLLDARQGAKESRRKWRRNRHRLTARIFVKEVI